MCVRFAKFTRVILYSNPSRKKTLNLKLMIIKRKHKAQHEKKIKNKKSKQQINVHTNVSRLAGVVEVGEEFDWWSEDSQYWTRRLRTLNHRGKRSDIERVR
jgi:hypothetical protein